MRCCLAVLALAACSSPVTPEDVHRVHVEEDGSALSVAQQFDTEGALVETVMVYSRGTETRELRVSGALLTDGGTTESGQSVRERLETIEPRLLARLVLAEPRFDIAVLAADALLSLDNASRDRASTIFVQSGEPEDLPLCAHLDACEPRS
jgi:hypothetical protein